MQFQHSLHFDAFYYVIAEQLQLSADQSTDCTCAHLILMKYHATLPITHNKVCQKIDDLDAHFAKFDIEISTKYWEHWELNWTTWIANYFVATTVIGMICLRQLDSL